MGVQDYQGPGIAAITEASVKKVSFKIGRLRIIYKVASKRIVEIVAIGPRRTIYEETYRLLKKPPSRGELRSWRTVP